MSLHYAVQVSQRLPDYQPFAVLAVLWRSHDATELATPDAFYDRSRPWCGSSTATGVIWHCWRKPNPAHYALAELARRKSSFHHIDSKR